MHQELALMALAASPTPEDACVFLKSEHNLMAEPSHLAAMVRFRPEQYEELRAKIVPLKEQTLTHNLLDDALYASGVTRVAMEQLREKLDEGRIPAQYLSRVARDLQDVQSKAIEKKLSLEGRPSVITETRTAPEIIRALETKGVLKQVDAVSTAVEEK
jgi:hypothetical protein